MDPPPDPPLLAAQPPTVAPASPTAAAAANPIPTRALTHKHPPYAEMIRAAISTLNERNGSSKRAVTKYIETHYSNLPPTHLALLAHHLKRLKISGQILMVKNSYKLPKSAPLAVNGADPVSARPKGRPGRPPKPKPKPYAIQAPVPVFAPQPLPPPQNGDIGQVPVNVPVGPVNGSGRGRGRPPGRSGLKPKNGQLPTSGGAGGGRRGRGRPKAVLAVRKISTVGRPRGRPPKPINVVAAPSSAATNVGGGVAAIITGKRRGRPPRADGEAKKPRKISAKPLGRPRKNEAAAATRTPDSSQLLVAYLDLKSKLEYLQLKVKQTVTSIVPSLVNEAVINALQELEHVALNVNAPPRIVQSQQPPQPQS